MRGPGRGIVGGSLVGVESPSGIGGIGRPRFPGHLLPSIHSGGVVRGALGAEKFRLLMDAGYARFWFGLVVFRLAY